MPNSIAIWNIKAKPEYHIKYKKHKSRDKINANIFKVLYGMLNKCKRTPLYTVRTRERIFVLVSGLLPLKFLLLYNAFPSQILRPLISPASSTVVQFSLYPSQNVSLSLQAWALCLSCGSILPQKFAPTDSLAYWINQTLSWSCTQPANAVPTYPSTHISRMLVKHVTFVNTGYASGHSLTPISMGLAAHQDDQFLLTFFFKR